MQKEIINKISELFIITRYKYLILFDNKDIKKVKYQTFNTYESKNVKKLSDYTVKRHLEGKATLGVFGTKTHTKFLTFDVDVKDKDYAKWTVYRLVNTLTELGIPQDKIYISSSGNKGYHVDLYFKQPIKNQIVKELFDLVLNKAELTKVDFGQVEYRPNGNSQGVKIPLGINFKNSNKNTNVCWYVDYEKGLKPIKNPVYILNIEQLDAEIIYNLMEKEKDVLPDEEEVEEVEETQGYIDTKYTPLPSYKQNIDEKETIESIKNLLNNGLTQTGMRHNSLLKLAKYFRHKGFTEDESKEMIINWMEQQDKKFYTTKWVEVLKDITDIIQYTYEKEISLTVQNRNLEVTYEEMKQVMTLKSKNEKLLAYCLLIHSKRYSLENGVFYMSYDQMAKASGLGWRTATRIISSLEENEIITIVERNQNVTDEKGKFITKKPNKYKVNIEQTENSNKVFKVNHDELDYSESFNICVLGLFDDGELKGLVTKNQYYEFMKLRETV